jgi:choline transport protein
MEGPQATEKQLESQLSEKRLESQLSGVEDETGPISELVNASGHKQEVDRNFGFFSICALSVCVDNAWAAGGGSLVCLLNFTFGIECT